MSFTPIPKLGRFRRFFWEPHVRNPKTVYFGGEMLGNKVVVGDIPQNLSDFEARGTTDFPPRNSMGLYTIEN